MNALVAGCGWLGEALARALHARGDRVTAVRRDPARAAALARLGVEVLGLDLAAPGAAAQLPGDLDLLVACQAARGDSPGDYRRAYLDANRTLIEVAATRHVGALVYTGSTGVFGSSRGEEVDEETPVEPASATAEVLAEAEVLLRAAAARGVPARIVRLSGLYGPGRSGVLDRVRTGAMALGPGDDAWTNWCHRDDAVGIVLAVAARGRDGAVYHGSDAAPARRRDVVRWIAERLGVEPAVRSGEPGGTARAPNRRVSSLRTRAELEYLLRYPTFRDGLLPLCDPPDMKRP